MWKEIEKMDYGNMIIWAILQKGLICFVPLISSR